MKKLMVFIMAAFMAVSFAGTASAVDATRVLSNANTLQFFASPVAETGCTTYLLAGGSADPNAANTNSSGATLLMINPVTGASTYWLGAAISRAGASAFGTPAVISGETVFIQLSNLQSPNAATAGTSVVAIDGITGGTYWTRSIPHVPTASGAVGGVNIGTQFAGNTLYTVPLTIDPAGSTIWGVSGVSIPGIGGGVSLWAMKMSNGAYSAFGTGVSTIFAAPVISGNSIYILGGNATAGVSLIAFNKNNPALVIRRDVYGATGNTPFATPAITGNSLFVVDATGGLTAYNTNTLLAGAQDFIQYATQASTAVTASPVTNGSFLVVTANDTNLGQAGVTVFDLSRPLAGSTGASWWFVWTGATVTATPAISNGILYVAVNRTSQGGVIDRFNLAGHSGRLAQPDYVSITQDSRGRILGFFDYSSPIIKGASLQIVSNGGTNIAGSAAANTPVLYYFDNVGANGNNYWQQFKADAARTGENTAAAVTPAPAGDSDSGCFISTIK
jgi:hypothetical protein